MPIQFWQHEVSDMRLRTEVKAGSVLDYACDEPTLPPHLTLTAKGAGSSEVTADMNFFREYNKLYYENFIYIAATHTFSQYVPAVSSGFLRCSSPEMNAVFQDCGEKACREEASSELCRTGSRRGHQNSEGHLKKEGRAAELRLKVNMALA